MEVAVPMRIGELSRRVGVSEHTLRAWERRYDLMRPARNAAGYRLYGAADERRVREVIATRGQGVPVSVAIQRVLDRERQLAEVLSGDAGAPGRAGSAGDAIRDLHQAADAFDEPALHVVLDELLSAQTLGEVIDEVLMPFLAELGARWADGDVTVAGEHFASRVLRRRLSALALSWAGGTGPIVLLACPAGEQHDMALLCFGLLLGRAGWRVHYLGADTPTDDISATVAVVRPAALVISATSSDLLTAMFATLRVPPTVLVCLAGAGATAALARDAGAVQLLPRIQDSVTILNATTAPAPGTPSPPAG